MKYLLVCVCVGLWRASAQKQDAKNLFGIKLKGVTVTDFATFPFLGASVLGALTSQIDTAIEVKCELSDVRPCPDDDTAIILGFEASGEVPPEESAWKNLISDDSIIPDIKIGGKIASVDREFFSYDATLSVEPMKDVPVQDTLEEKLEKALKGRKSFMKLRLKDHIYQNISQDYEEMGQLTAKVRIVTSKVLSVPENSVFILEVYEGSVIVAFTAYSEEDETQDGTGTESAKHAERWARALEEKNAEISDAFADVDFAHEPLNSDPTEVPGNENSTVIIGPDDTEANKYLGAIIGGLVGGFLLLAVLGVILYFVLRKKKGQKKNTKNKQTISRLPSDALTPVNDSSPASPGGLKEINVDDTK